MRNRKVPDSQSENLFGSRSLGEIVEIVMHKRRRKAGIAQVVADVRKVATKDEYEGFAEQGLAPLVRRELTRPDSKGLPRFLSVNGKYLALALFDPADYEEKARDYAKRSKENVAQVYALAEACQEAHGKSFDPAAICSEYGLTKAA